MKKFLFSFAFAAILFSACNNNANTAEATEAQEEATATEASATFNIVSEESSVKWTGSKITGDKHVGSIKISEGSISLENGAINAGSFTIDMATIAEDSASAKTAEMATKLVGHLTSPDFFTVSEFPTATFAISSATADSLTGNLTIKGITKAITIPYTSTLEGDVMKATSEFSIDRTNWDIKYGSGSFFKNLGDKVINDKIDFVVNLTAKK